MKIKNLTKAANRIKKAIAQKERIVLYGDADLDGTCAVIILEEAIKSLGGAIAAFYFPNKEKEGYGITRKALRRLNHYAPALLIASDLGISNFEEIPLARKLGFEVILIDHHEVLGKLPQANIIVDPKQPSDSYPFKGLAACGLAFKVAELVVGKNISTSLRNSMVELAALGTVADMMPRLEDNISIIGEGLESLADSWRPGIRALLESEPIASLERMEAKVQQMISLLNARDVKEGYPSAFRLLCCSSLSKAKNMVRVFEQKNRLRKEQISRLVEHVRMRIFSKQADPIVFEGGEHFDYMLLGAVASIISQETGKPTFVFKQRRTESLGSVRAPAGFDTVKAMQHCAKFLDTYGGHAQASGFQTSNDKLEGLKLCLADYFRSPTSKKS